MVLADFWGGLVSEQCLIQVSSSAFRIAYSLAVADKIQWLGLVTCSIGVVDPGRVGDASLVWVPVADARG
jgi:hypothetical protein